MRKYALNYDWVTVTKTFESDHYPRLDDELYVWKDWVKEWVCPLFDHYCRLEMVQPSRFYYMGFREVVSGARIDVAKDGKAQGIRIVLSGESLVYVLNYDNMIEWFQLNGFNFTRVDVALDLFDDLTVDAIKADYMENSEVADSRAFAEIKKPTGHTFYIGSRSSDKMMRVYDKRLETKSEGEVWTRLEIEVKGRTCRLMGEGGFPSLKQYVVMMREFLRLEPCETLVMLDEVAGNTVPLKLTVGRKDSKRFLWLTTQVAMAMRNLIKQDVSEALDAMSILEDALDDSFSFMLEDAESVIAFKRWD